MIEVDKMKNIDIEMYRLPEHTMTVINNLNSIFKGMNDNKSYNKPYNKNEKTEYKKKSENDPTVKNTYPPTKYLAVTKRKADIGIQRDIKEITLLMNKMTDKTYDIISKELFESLEYVLKEYAGNDELEKITDNLNNTIKYNAAYSGIYSKFYAILVSKYGTLFTEGLNKLNTIFENSMDDMWYVDSEEDYDKFCNMNENNKVRKSLIIFITKLTMNGYYTQETYAKYMNLIMNKIEEYMDLENSTPIVEELGEIMYSMLTSSVLETTKTFECWEHILNFVQKMKSVSPKSVKSFSMRCKFKYMDMNDYLIGKKK
tara:strand:+ start:506 stop:1450 length:945 start_codon:yes stop_codon:yes gene_type:complete